MLKLAYLDEFTRKAVAQIIMRVYSAVEVLVRLGVGQKNEPKDMCNNPVNFFSYVMVRGNLWED